MSVIPAPSTARHHDEDFSSLATGPENDKQSQTPEEAAGTDCDQ